MTVADLWARLGNLPFDLDVELIAYPAYEDEIILSVSDAKVEDVIQFCGSRPCARTDKVRSGGEPSRARPHGDHYHRAQVVRVSA